MMMGGGCARPHLRLRPSPLDNIFDTLLQITLFTYLCNILLVTNTNFKNKIIHSEFLTTGQIRVLNSITEIAIFKTVINSKAHTNTT